MTLSMNIGRITTASCMTGVTTHLRQIQEILKYTHADPQIQKPQVGPQRGRGKIEVSVLPKVLLLNLRSNSHC